MPSPIVEATHKRASEEMTGMSFLEHLEELRRRLIYRIYGTLSAYMEE